MVETMSTSVERIDVENFDMNRIKNEKGLTCNQNACSNIVISEAKPI